MAEAAKYLGVNAGSLPRWKTELGQQGPGAFSGKGRQTPEQAELYGLREENPQLRMERDILTRIPH
jgi:transposase